MYNGILFSLSLFLPALVYFRVFDRSPYIGIHERGFSLFLFFCSSPANIILYILYLFEHVLDIFSRHLFCVLTFFYIIYTIDIEYSYIHTCNPNPYFRHHRETHENSAKISIYYKIQVSIIAYVNSCNKIDKINEKILIKKKLNNFSQYHQCGVNPTSGYRNFVVVACNISSSSHTVLTEFNFSRGFHIEMKMCNAHIRRLLSLLSLLLDK